VGVALSVLALLAGAALFLRLYQSELVRRTEAELIAQGAFVRSLYRERLVRQLAAGCGGPGGLEEYGRPVEVAWPVRDDELRPIPPRLDLASELIDVPAPEATATRRDADRCARSAGREIQSMLDEVQRITLSGIMVVDPRGTIVATTQRNRGRSLYHRNEVARALEGEIVTKVRHREGALGEWSLESIKRRTQLRVFVTIPVTHEGRLLGAVSLVRTPLSFLKGMYRNRWVFGTLFGAILFVAVAIGTATAFFLGRPIRRLIEQTRRFAREGADATEPLERPGTREIDELSRAFAEMAETVQERNEYIRTFARNVSHEFKTPISSIRGTVELLEDHVDSMSDERRRRFLNMVDENAERMERLVDRLLDLAEAEVFQSGNETCRLGEVLETVAQRFDGLEVDRDLGGESRRLPMAAETLESILSNLLENAREEGAATVRVAARAAGDGDAIEVVVHDDGPGVSEGNADKIFDAFFSADRSEGDTGLGLAVVRALMQAHDGSIELADSDEGAKFRLRFPA